MQLRYAICLTLAATLAIHASQLALWRALVGSSAAEAGGGLAPSADEAASPSAPADSAGGLRERWELWPYGPGGSLASAPRVGVGSLASAPRVGIVTGGSSDLFGAGEGSYGDVTGCLLRMLAARRGYALHVERAMQRIGAERPVAWNKIPLLAERLADVDLLVWVDADVAWTAGDVDFAELFLRRLSTREACTGHLGQARWDSVAGGAAGAEAERDAEGIFLWSSADVRPKQQKNMNLNSAVFALRSGDAGRRFLDAVWADGNDPMSFTRYNKGWRKQPPGNHYYGWPFEQGSIWTVLDSDPDLLRRTCVVEAGELHSVQYARWRPGSPGAHMPGMNNEARRAAACRHFAEAVSGPGQCGAALRQCPDIFAGRLLAAWADDLCVHCLGASSAAANASRGRPSSEELGASDWKEFDCRCLKGS